jgi:hypothetical protein
MRVSSNTAPETLSIRHWWILTFVLLVALPIVLALNFMNEMFAWYSQQFVEPAMQRSLGFSGGEVTIHQGNTSFAWYGIVSVSPGGAFERAGVKPGDLPVGYQHGTRTGMISDLQNSRGRSIELHFINRAAYEAGNYRPRSVTVNVPAN